MPLTKEEKATLEALPNQSPPDWEQAEKTIRAARDGELPSDWAEHLQNSGVYDRKCRSRLTRQYHGA